MRAVIPYAPYFKISEALLEQAADQLDLDRGTMLRLTSYPGGTQARSALVSMGVDVLHQSTSPFGEQFVVGVPPQGLVPLAQLDLVQWVEPFEHRAFANDLTRVLVGVDLETTNETNQNHHGLSGEGMWVNVNDTGIDSSHPDLGTGFTPMTFLDFFRIASHRWRTKIVGPIHGQSYLPIGIFWGTERTWQVSSLVLERILPR